MAECASSVTNHPHSFPSVQMSHSRRGSALTGSPTSNLLSDNLVDFVLDFRPNDTAAQGPRSSAAVEALSSMLTEIVVNGFLYELQTVDIDRLLILLHCPIRPLRREYYRSRLSDWLNGVGSSEFDPDEEKSVDRVLRLTSSERLRLIHQILVNPARHQGMELCDPEKQWHPYIFKLAPIHNVEYNKEWMRKWSRKWFLTMDDVASIQRQFGESIAYYFVFLQTYFVWLSIPTLFGTLVFLFNMDYSAWYGALTSIWSLLFTELWARKERDLATAWQVINVSKHEQERHGFYADQYVVDEVTGDRVKHYSPWKRWTIRALTIPVILALVAILAFSIFFIFLGDVVIGEYYHGPFKTYVVFIPSIVYAAVIPQFSVLYRLLATKLTYYENHRTTSEHSNSLVEKMFLVNFFVNFSSPLFYGLLYIPFADQVGQSIARRFGLESSVKLDSSLFRQQIVSFLMTGQIINLVQEVIVPLVTRYLANRAKKIVSRENKSLDEKSDSIVKKRLKSLVKQLDLPEYDIHDDYAEMIAQFGYVVAFSSAWPLTSVAAFMNNWLELRSDAVKLCINMSRPIPRRVETIGPWLTYLRFFSWLGVILNTTWILLYGPNASKTSLIVGALIIFLAEHTFLALRHILQLILTYLPSHSEKQQKKEEWLLKQKYLQALEDADDESDEVEEKETVAEKGTLAKNGSWKVPKMVKVSSAISFQSPRDRADEIRQHCENTVRNMFKTR